MTVKLHRRRAHRLTWWFVGLESLSIAIAGTIAYGWELLVLMLVVNALPDIPLIGGLLPAVDGGAAKSKMSDRKLKPGRVRLHNMTHSTEISSAVIAAGGLLWWFSIPAGREIFFVGISLIFHMAVERLFFDHYFPDGSGAIEQR